MTIPEAAGTPAPDGGPPARAHSFPEVLGEAALTAVLSPSSHNCQPWALTRVVTPGARRAAAALVGQDAPEYLVLGLDRRHQLVALPAHAVEMELSCGVYWRLLLRGLAAGGWTASAVRVLQDGEGDELRPKAREFWTPLCVAALRPGPPSGERPAELHATGLARRTHRGPYRPEPLAAELLRDLEEDPPTGPYEADEPAVTVRHLTRPEELRDFASFVARWAGRDFAHRRAWRETHSYVRFGAGAAAERGDGFTLDQLFGPLSGPRRLVMRGALAPAAMAVLGPVGYHRLLAAGLADLVRHSPAVVTMGLPGAEPGRGALLRGGARLADYWWRATRLGLSLHPISVVIQHDDLRELLRRRLGLPGRTFFVARLGVPAGPAAPRSHRRITEALYETV